MPSTMIHLVIARKYDKDASAAFYIGNIAPDQESNREKKDAIHFRKSNDRMSSLTNYAMSLNLKSDFDLGMLLHLYTDYYWDKEALKNFIVNYKNENWFLPYRYEIGLAGGWLYHHKDWSESIFEKMEDCPEEDYCNNPTVDAKLVTEYVSKNKRWHKLNDIGPSTFYSSEYIDDFSNRLVTKFKPWVKDIATL